jgi:glycosyltransferase involved in cell wall biosynthesis
VSYWAPIVITLARWLRRANLPTFMDCQNVLPHEPNFLDRPVTALTLRQADACIVYSVEHRQELLDIVPGIPHALVPFPAYGPMAHTILDRSEAQRQLGLDGAVALFFGFVRPYKGLSVLLQAMAEVVQHSPVHLLIVGEFWRGGEDYHRLISHLELDAWTTVVDQYVADEELGLYFGAADVVIMPYLEPCQSGVLALAQAFHKPVIASRLGGLVDGVLEGQTGLLVQPNDASALAKAILQFYQMNLGDTMEPHLKGANLDVGWDALTKALVDVTTIAKTGLLAGWSGAYG